LRSLWTAEILKVSLTIALIDGLTVEEFQRLLAQLEEPFRTMAFVCACLGLRISECLALRRSDVDWLNGTLCVERGIVIRLSMM